MTPACPPHAGASFCFSACGNVQRSKGIQIRFSTPSGTKLIVSLSADHRPVVPAQRQGRHIQPISMLPAGTLQIRTDDGIGCCTAGRHHSGTSALLRRRHSAGTNISLTAFVKSSASDALSSSRPVCAALWAKFTTAVFSPEKLIYQKSLPLTCAWADHRFLCRTSALRQRIHRCAAWIGQTQHPGRLIKHPPARVIPRGADDFQIRIIFYVHNQSIAAGNGQSQKRRLQFRKGDIIGSNMPPHMVHRD